MSKIMIYLVLGWQLIVILLYGGGIFGDLYYLIGIPPHQFGWYKLVTSAVCFLLLELPAIAIIIYSRIK